MEDTGTGTFTHLFMFPSLACSLFGWTMSLWVLVYFGSFIDLILPSSPTTIYLVCLRPWAVCSSLREENRGGVFSNRGYSATSNRYILVTYLQMYIILLDW